ncbi:hypothetical protein LCGC14_3130520 [marine sediment metagenome]|uniref:Uncharacterized protein n=1 Tax=marine sediment metagenome TaxID=412755 RepID=A0A0F8VZS7_9ZZZZ
MPLITYLIRYGSPQVAIRSSAFTSWESRKRNLLNREPGQLKWELMEIAEEIFGGYHSAWAPQPSWERMHPFLFRSRELLIEAHISAVARQFVSELSSEDVARIWGMEDVRLVMES